MRFWEFLCFKLPRISVFYFKNRGDVRSMWIFVEGLSHWCVENIETSSFMVSLVKLYEKKQYDWTHVWVQIFCSSFGQTLRLLKTHKCGRGFRKHKETPENQGRCCYKLSSISGGGGQGTDGCVVAYDQKTETEQRYRRECLVRQFLIEIMRIRVQDLQTQPNRHVLQTVKHNHLTSSRDEHSWTGTGHSDELHRETNERENTVSI